MRFHHIPVFKTGALVHSATPPRRLYKIIPPRPASANPPPQARLGKSGLISEGATPLGGEKALRRAGSDNSEPSESRSVGASTPMNCPGSGVRRDAGGMLAAFGESLSHASVRRDAQEAGEDARRSLAERDRGRRLGVVAPGLVGSERGCPKPSPPARGVERQASGAVAPSPAGGTSRTSIGRTTRRSGRRSASSPPAAFRDSATSASCSPNPRRGLPLGCFRPRGGLAPLPPRCPRPSRGRWGRSCSRP